ncbi:MAG: hypothetical protein JWL76_1442 [Thermoleophilia bacterium]|nr:hypothetical protein [Thermoleophilia bacterium]
MPLIVTMVPVTTRSALAGAHLDSLRRIAEAIDRGVADGIDPPDEPFDVYELSDDDAPPPPPPTIRLTSRIPHRTTGVGTGFTQKHRFVLLSSLLTEPSDTSGLAP